MYRLEGFSRVAALTTRTYLDVFGSFLIPQWVTFISIIDTILPWSLGILSELSFMDKALFILEQAP